MKFFASLSILSLALSASALRTVVPGEGADTRPISGGTLNPNEGGCALWTNYWEF